MHRRLWLSIVAVAIGAALLVAAGFASPAQSSTSGANSSFAGAKKGGTLRLNMSSSDVDYIDPALAYYQLSWDILYIACRPLLNYPDKPAPAGSRLFPDGAAAFPKVTNHGRTYTFRIRRGMRFSNGVPITARNYKAAFDRDANPKMESPALPFFQDIIGATDAQGNAHTPVSGVRAKGYTLSIRLKKAGPDILSRVAMLFFCPIPAPGQKGAPKITSQGVNTFPGSGPYYVAARTPNGPILIKRNRFYKGPRPHNANAISVVAVNTNPDTSFNQVQRGEINYDMGGLPPTVHAGLAKKYGINKSRYFVTPEIATRYLALNNQRLFGSVKLRKAANYAIDRKGMINLRGAFAGHATDQLLPANLRGYKNANIFPFRPNLAQARKLAGGAKHNAVMYTTTSPIGTNQGVLVQSLFKNIGISVDVNRYGTSTMYKKCGTKSEAFDICNVGWIADYPDPFDFMNVLLSGDSIHESNNNNYSYFNNARVNRQLASASRLFGAKRFSTYGSLDVSIMKNYAPIVAWDNDNDREFISGKTGCYVAQPVYGLADLSVLCLK